MSQAKKHKVPRIKLTQKTMDIYVSARTTINHIAYLMPISPGKTAQALGIVFSSVKSNLPYDLTVRPIMPQDTL